MSLSKEEDPSAAGKGKTAPRLLEVQSRSSAMKKGLFGSKKLWSTLFPPSFERRQGIRCSSEPILRGKNQADSEEDPKEEASGADFQAKRGFSASPLFSCRFPRFRKKSLGEGASSSRNEADLNNFSSDEDMEGFSGLVGSDPHGLAVMVLPSSPETRGKGPSFLGNYGLMVAENLEVISSSHFQSPPSSIPPSCGLTFSFLSPSTPILPGLAFQSQVPMENRVNSNFFSKKDNVAYEGQTFVDIPTLEMEVIQPAFPYQMFQNVNPLSPKPISPIKDSNMVTVNQGINAGSPSGEFQIEGLSPRKMEKVREVLKSLDIKVYSRRKSRYSTGL